VVFDDVINTLRQDARADARRDQSQHRVDRLGFRSEFELISFALPVA
jgi:hypothetical protein